MSLKLSMFSKRQRIDQKRYYGLKKAGRCVRCRRVRDGLSEVHCLRCQRLKRDANRRKYDHRPQPSCGVGRPLKEES